MRTSLAAALLLVVAATPLFAQRRGEVSEERNATIPAEGATIVEVEAMAGELRIEGRAGLREVRVRGTARASSRRRLEDLTLETRRDGDRVLVLVDHDGDDWRNNGDDDWVALDLFIEVPAGIAVEVEDGSGGVEIKGVGALRVHDGSGELMIEDITGDVRINDGSGEIVVRGVRGTLRVSDGSGEIRATDVTGSVRVDSDGSGDISVRQVGGDFIVERKGSGAVHHSDVRGTVDVPEPRSARRWRRR